MSVLPIFENVKIFLGFGSLLAITLINNSYQSYPVISVGGTQKQSESNPLGGNPPFYQFDKISIIDCQNIYGLNLETYEWSVSEIKDYTNKCSEKDLLSPEQIKNIIIDRLTQDGFQGPEIFPPKIINEETK